MIKVLLERKVPKGKFKELIGFLNELRAGALRHTGYVSGETVIKGNNQLDVLVISTWLSEDHWKAWTTSEVCVELDQMVDTLVGKPPRVNMYRAPYPLE